MQCPHCGHNDSRVIDSRGVEQGVRRRRQCTECDARFTTHERAENANMSIVKKDRRSERFDREKFLQGIRKACEKRPLPTGAVEKLADDIESELQLMGKTEIPSSMVGEIVMDKLLKLDHIAYIRFASVYRAFTDIGSLKQEVDTIVAGSELSAQLPLISGNDLNSLSRRQPSAK